MLDGAPAGLVATRTAGEVRFFAELSWNSPRGAADLRAALIGASIGGGRLCVEREGGRVRLEERVLAPTEEDLGAELSALARAAAECAALSGALLEVSVVRRAHPRVALPWALGALARDLYEAGVAVRFAPHGAAAPEADVWVGTGGPGGALEAYLLSHPRWRVAGR